MKTTDHGKKGFTLAEVLITLAIIGTVAALTIPSIVRNYRDVQYKSAYKKAYAMLSQSFNMAKMEVGGNPVCYYLYTGSYGALTQDCNALFVELEKNWKIIKKCANNGYANGCLPEYKGTDEVCAENNPDWTPEQVEAKMYGSAIGFRTRNNIKALRSYVLADGITIMFNSGSLPTIVAVDLNGKKPPNKWGYDLFRFVLRGTGNGDTRYIYYSGQYEKGGKSDEQMFRQAIAGQN